MTGHTGFKGAWLCALLHRLGATVSGYALDPPTSPSLFQSLGADHLAASTIADIRDSGRLVAAITAAEPDVVFHLAAQAIVRRARVEPAETFDVNVMGTVRLLDAVRHAASVKAMVVVTSDKVYDNVEWPWAYRETDRLGGKEAYGASKAACEIAVQAWRHAFLSKLDRPIAVATARAGNVIGGGDWAEDRLIPDAMRAFAAGSPLVVRNPSAIRPWQHVLEPLAGYCRLACALLDSEDLPDDLGFNFGPTAEDARSVAWVSDAVARLWGDGASWRQDPGVQPYEARLLEVDSSRVHAVLGWSPKWRLDDGLERTVAWYRDVGRGENARRVTLAQIEDHLVG